MVIKSPDRICPECGQGFVAHHGRMRFCSREHAAAFHNRQMGRGKIAVSILQTWRWRTAEVSAEDMAFAHKELCALAGLFNREDKAAGRKPYLTLQDRREDGWRAVDAIK
jgi:ribosomal protein S27AE